MYTRAHTNFFCSITLYKLYSQKTKKKSCNHLIWLIGLLDWLDSQSQIVSNKIPQDDSVRFGGASTVATRQDAALILFVEKKNQNWKKEKEHHDL